MAVRHTVSILLSTTLHLGDMQPSSLQQPCQNSVVALPSTEVNGIHQRKYH
jgi:hypothetical protein